MKALLNVGSELAKETIEPTAAAIEKIFKAASDNGIEQTTVRTALETLGRVTEVKNITITNSVFRGGHTVNLDDPKTEDPTSGVSVGSTP